MYSSNIPHLVRLFNHKIPHPLFHGAIQLKNCRFYGKYIGYGRKISIWFSEQSLKVSKAYTRQFEFIAAQRVRRSLQFLQLYAKIWDDIPFRRFMRSWRRRLSRNTKEFLMSAVGVTMFNWDDERITDEEIYCYTKEIEKIHELRCATVICKSCSLRLIIDHQQPDVQYCTCHSTKQNVAAVNDDDEWQPFIERQDTLIWRKEEKDTGLYAYKVFGSYSDVSAEEYLQVQVDIDYRKAWDRTARELEIIDVDPTSASIKNDHTDVIYWEMIWPRLFSNRDYVYKRRWIVDRAKGIVIIANKITDHPNAPNRPDTYRVTSYWSYTVIKSCKGFSEPGIQFVLTYFEDPGINIPSAVTSWVAMSGLPDFLCRMRQAAREYKSYIYEKYQSDQVCETREILEGEIINNESFTNVQKDDSESIVDDTSTDESSAIEASVNDEESEEEAIVSDKEIVLEQSAQDQPGFFRYFFLTKLFA